MRASTERPWTVAKLTRKISLALEDFGPLAVEGELSQVTVAGSGHLYATLKDSEATVSVVMWRSSVTRNGPIPKQGDRVLVRGSLSVYGPRGQYQLVARSIRPVGAGDLAAQFEALKARLLDEGLFAEEQKQELPWLPRGVGLATAGGSAALADMVDSIRGRFPSMPIVHAPCLVQGHGAAAEIVRALGRLDRHPGVAVIIAGRGGGSLEDLWAFNEEPVVRAIAACSTPVISAVGHETDTTLADLVADQRAKTPTMAGELVVPVEEALHEHLDDLQAGLDGVMDELLTTARGRLAALASHRALAGPEHQLHLRQQRLDELQHRLDGLADRGVRDAHERLAMLTREVRLCSPRRDLATGLDRLARFKQALDGQAGRLVADADRQFGAAIGRLEALSPLKVLGRGYAFVQDSDGHVARSVEDLAVGDQLSARMADGWVDAEVTAKRLTDP